MFFFQKSLFRQKQRVSCAYSNVSKESSIIHFENDELLISNVSLILLKLFFSFFISFCIRNSKQTSLELCQTSTMDLFCKNGKKLVFLILYAGSSENQKVFNFWKRTCKSIQLFRLFLKPLDSVRDI